MEVYQSKARKDVRSFSCALKALDPIDTVVVVEID